MKNSYLMLAHCRFIAAFLPFDPHLYICHFDPDYAAGIIPPICSLNSDALCRNLNTAG